MTPNFTDEKKEYLRMASRFLKEVGLYGLWIRYCYNPKTSKSWLHEKCYDATDILGKTSFTGWVKDYTADKNMIRVLDNNSICIYELFGEYLKKVEQKDCWQDYLNVDIEKKKITIK